MPFLLIVKINLKNNSEFEEPFFLVSSDCHNEYDFFPIVFIISCLSVDYTINRMNNFGFCGVKIEYPYGNFVKF